MRKITAFIIAAIMIFTAVTASAATPDFLYQSHTNYSSEQTLSVELKSAESIVNLLDELGALEYMTDYFNVEGFLMSLLSADFKMSTQCDISDDYNQQKMSVQVEASNTVEPNRNLKIAVDAKTGLWYNVDIAEEKIEMIQSLPAMNKYMYFDLAKLMPEDDRAQYFEVAKVIYSKPVVEQIQKFSVDTFTKNADVKLSGGKYTIKIDNEALVTAIDEIIAYGVELTNAINPDYIDFEIPSFEGLKLLGKKGIEIKYSLSGGKPSKMEMTADICLDISNIYTHFTGEEWEYESKGIVELQMKSSATMSKYGKTKVELPELTAENSIDIAERYAMPEPIEGDYEPEYPYYWVSCYAEDMPKIDGNLYVPLRNTLVDAYDESVNISYDDGVITLENTDIPEGYEVVMTVKPGDKVIVNQYAGTEVKFGKEEYSIVRMADILAIVE